MCDLYLCAFAFICLIYMRGWKKTYGEYPRSRPLPSLRRRGRTRPRESPLACHPNACGEWTVDGAGCRPQEASGEKHTDNQRRDLEQQSLPFSCEASWVEREGLEQDTKLFPVQKYSVRTDRHPWTTAAWEAVVVVVAAVSTWSPRLFQLRRTLLGLLWFERRVLLSCFSQMQSSSSRTQEGAATQ